MFRFTKLKAPTHYWHLSTLDQEGWKGYILRHIRYLDIFFAFLECQPAQTARLCYIVTSPQNRGGVYIFTAVCQCVCLCLSVCLSSSAFQSEGRMIKLSYGIFTPPQIHGGVKFSLQFVCLPVCLSVSLCQCVSGFLVKKNSSWIIAAIWTRFSLNGCLQHWLGLHWNWWPWVKGQGHSD